VETSRVDLNLTLLILSSIASSRTASSLSWLARFSDSWRMVSASLAEFALTSWLAAATFRKLFAFATFIS